MTDTGELDSTATPSGGRSTSLIAASIILALVAAGAVWAVFIRDRQGSQEVLDSEINGYRSVGYFVQWGIYDRNYHVKDMVDSGVVDNLTHINYAFGNIHPEDLTCFIVTERGVGDAWADYGKHYAPEESVAGVLDELDNPMVGNFGQLKQLKEQYPHLKVLISLGGWTWSENFSRAAATPESREKFVESCIDIYIKGNLPVDGSKGGEGVAAGLFDGIDLDWEWPASYNAHEHNHVDVENDRDNFEALVHEFRRQLDEYGKETSKHYLLTAFGPANLNDIEVGGWNNPALFESFDFVNVQGYDLHGAWNPTLAGHQGNLHIDPNSAVDASLLTSAETAVTAYLDNGVPPEQITLGIPMYGRGWEGVTVEGAGGGAWAPAEKAATTLPRYEAGYEDYWMVKEIGEAYYDEDIIAAWRWDGDQWWTYDDPISTKAKVEWVAERGLGGVMWWSVDGDRDGDLPQAMVEALDTLPRGPVTVE